MCRKLKLCSRPRTREQFQSILPILCILVIFWDGYVNCCTLYEGGVLRLIICACCSLQAVSFVGLDAAFNNTWDWKGRAEKVGDISSRQVYTTNDQTCR
jgi:hypothetical protein